MSTRRSVITIVLGVATLVFFTYGLQRLKAIGVMAAIGIGFFLTLGVLYLLSGVIDEGITKLERRWQELGREWARRDNAESQKTGK